MRRSDLPHNHRRKGAAVVELAVCMPVLVLLVIGGASMAYTINLKHQAKLLANTAAVEAMNPGVRLADAIDKAITLAASTRLVGTQVSMGNAGTDLVFARVTIPAAGNNPLATIFPFITEVTAESITYRNEN